MNARMPIDKTGILFKDFYVDRNTKKIPVTAVGRDGKLHFVGWFDNSIAAYEAQKNFKS